MTSHTSYLALLHETTVRDMTDKKSIEIASTMIIFFGIKYSRNCVIPIGYLQLLLRFAVSD